MNLERRCSSKTQGIVSGGFRMTQLSQPTSTRSILIAFYKSFPYTLATVNQQAKSYCQQPLLNSSYHPVEPQDIIHNIYRQWQVGCVIPTHHRVSDTAMSWTQPLFFLHFSLCSLSGSKLLSSTCHAQGMRWSSGQVPVDREGPCPPEAQTLELKRAVQ